MVRFLYMVLEDVIYDSRLIYPDLESNIDYLGCGKYIHNVDELLIGRVT